MERRDSEVAPCQSFTLQPSKNYGEDILSKLNALREEASFTDAILCVGTEEYPCHRNVLAVSSPYFQAMFTTDLRESKQVKINMNEISPSTMSDIIDYVYTGCVEVNVDNAQELLAAGSLFQYPSIVEACCEFLRGHLHPSNCLGIENFAQLHTCSKLEMEAHNFTLDNFSIVVEFEEFLDLTLQRLVSYLASDLIDVRTEEYVYDAAMRWLHHDLENRKKHLNSVMANIRLTTVDVVYLETVIRNDPLIQSMEQCCSIVEEAWKYHESRTDQAAQRRRSIRTDETIPRPSTVAREVMVLIGGKYDVSVEMYDPYKDKWHPLPELPKSLEWFGVCAVDNNIFVTGGMADNQILSDVWRFEALNQRWTKRAPMLVPRAQHVSTVLNGNVYVLGGVQLTTENRYLAVERMDCYDVKKDEWTNVGMSPIPRRLSSATAYKESIVELGGTQSGARVKTMESHICTPSGHLTYSGEQFVLPESIQFSKLVVINGVFYIIWEDSKKVLSLNPLKRTFKWLPDMHYRHLYCGATVLNSKLYVAGGLPTLKGLADVDNVVPSNVVECFDPATNTWSIAKSMTRKRAYHGCVTIEMK